MLIIADILLILFSPPFSFDYALSICFAFAIAAADFADYFRAFAADAADIAFDFFRFSLLIIADYLFSLIFALCHLTLPLLMPLYCFIIAPYIRHYFRFDAIHTLLALRWLFSPLFRHISFDCYYFICWCLFSSLMLIRAIDIAWCWLPCHAATLALMPLRCCRYMPPADIIIPS